MTREQNGTLLCVLWLTITVILFASMIPADAAVFSLLLFGALGLALWGVKDPERRDR